MGGGNDKSKDVSSGKPVGNRTVGKPKRRRQDNIKVDVKAVSCQSVDRIGFNSGFCEHYNEHFGSINGMTFLEQFTVYRFSKST